MLEGRQSSGPDVDTSCGATVKVLVGLHLVEVSCGADREAVVAVKLELGIGKSVTTCESTTSLVGVVSPVVGADGVAVGDVGVKLDNPSKELAGVVEVELNLVGGGRDRLVTSELDLLDEVLVRDLGKPAALVGVEVDVVDVELSVDKSGCARRGEGAIVRLDALGSGTELERDADLVVLESNKWEREPRVATARIPRLSAYLAYVSMSY